MEVHQGYAEPWKVTLVDTGEDTLTGGRLKRVADYVKDEEAFCFTYGDGVGDVNITELVAFHKPQNVKATLTGTIPPGRFGVLNLNGSKVKSFMEKPKGDGRVRVPDDAVANSISAGQSGTVNGANYDWRCDLFCAHPACDSI